MTANIVGSILEFVESLRLTPSDEFLYISICLLSLERVGGDGGGRRGSVVM